ncbi:hypothetical protein [Demequina oxidasica]|uniref:hypothetical protein n=1 Tax=Demequina oxidasica TaxID=676199 RepID=UPI0007857FAD|nr:hypothetical protein [Demequina oxidasica]
MTRPTTITRAAALLATLTLVAGCSSGSDAESADDAANVEVTSSAEGNPDDAAGDGDGVENVDQPDSDPTVANGATTADDAPTGSDDELPEGLPVPSIQADHTQSFPPNFWIREYYDGVDEAVYADLMADLESAGYTVTSETDGIVGTTTEMSNGSEYLVKVDFVNAPPDVTISYYVFTEDFAPSA